MAKKLKIWDGTAYAMVDAGNADTVGGKTPGAVNGIATLDANGKLTASQAPSSSGINAPNYWIR